MPNLMHYAFIDESGTVGSETGTHFFVFALICTRQPREIELPIRRAMKNYGTNLSRGEIKAANFEEKAIARLLTEIAKEDVFIIATIVDQSLIVKPPTDIEDIYRRVVSKTVYKLVERYPRVNICLDRRYTNEQLRFELESQIRESIQYLPQKVVMIQQENSINRKELQAVDAVVWALFQKYERDNVNFYQIISSKIIDEEIIRKRDWTV